MPLTLALPSDTWDSLLSHQLMESQGKAEVNTLTQHNTTWLSSVCLDLNYIFHCRAASAPVFPYLDSDVPVVFILSILHQLPDDTKVVCVPGLVCVWPRGRRPSLAKASQQRVFVTQLLNVHHDPLLNPSNFFSGRLHICGEENAPLWTGHVLQWQVNKLPLYWSRDHIRRCTPDFWGSHACGPGKLGRHSSLDPTSGSSWLWMFLGKLVSESATVSLVSLPGSVVPPSRSRLLSDTFWRVQGRAGASICPIHCP